MQNIFLLETKFYFLEQNISALLSVKINSLTPTTLGILVISGLFTSFNPCFISLIPLSISSLPNERNNIYKIFLFTLGLLSSLLVLIIGAYYISYQSSWLIKSLPAISSILIIISGLYLLKILNIYILPTEIQNLIKIKNDYSSNILIGFIIGLTSTPCSTPILTTILLWISSTSYFLTGLIYLGFYLLGVVIPLTAILIIANKYKSIHLFTKTWYYYTELSGSIVLGIGIFSFLNKTFT